MDGVTTEEEPNSDDEAPAKTQKTKKPVAVKAQNGSAKKPKQAAPAKSAAKRRRKSGGDDDDDSSDGDDAGGGNGGGRAGGGSRQGNGEKMWDTLKHGGVMFPPEYQQNHVKLLYDGKPVELDRAQEETAGFYAAMTGSPYLEKPTFINNFWEGFQAILGPKHVIKCLEKCDFSRIYNWQMAQREAKKTMSKEVGPAVAFICINQSWTCLAECVVIFGYPLAELLRVLHRQSFDCLRPPQSLQDQIWFAGNVVLAV